MISIVRSLVISAVFCFALSFFIDSTWNNYYINLTLTISILITFFQIEKDKDIANILIRKYSDSLSELEESELLLKIFKSSPSIILSKLRFASNFARLEFSSNTLYFMFIAYLKLFYDIYKLNFISIGYLIFLLFLNYYFDHNHKFYYDNNKRDIDNIKRNFSRKYGKDHQLTDFQVQVYFELLVDSILLASKERRL
jgi:hypothetical protein